MATALQNADKHAKSIETMCAQLDAWTTQIDTLVARCLAAGAQDHDPYRVRIEEMRLAVDVLRSKLHAYGQPDTAKGTWGAFQAEVRPMWRAVELGTKAIFTPVPHSAEA